MYYLLKTLDTIGNCQRTDVSLGATQHTHKQTSETLNSIGRQSCEIKGKTPLSHEVVCCQMLDFGASKLNSEVPKSNSWKFTSFSKTTLLQWELFPKMFYTMKRSSLVVTK